MLGAIHSETDMGGNHIPEKEQLLLLVIQSRKLHSITYLTSIIPFLSTSTETACWQDEYLLCNSVDLADALSIAHNRDLGFSDTQWDWSS